MRVCDRHPRKKASRTFHVVEDDSRFDLCEKCAAQIREFMSNPRKERVDEKRNILGLKKKSA